MSTLIRCSLLFILIIFSAVTPGTVHTKQSSLKEAKRLTEKVLGVTLTIYRGSFMPIDATEPVQAMIMKGKKKARDLRFGADDTLLESLEHHGWQCVDLYAADSCDGTQFACKKEGLLCVFSITLVMDYDYYKSLTKEQNQRLVNDPEIYVTVSCIQQ